jgi:hypothetical protein
MLYVTFLLPQESLILLDSLKRKAGETLSNWRRVTFFPRFSAENGYTKKLSLAVPPVHRAADAVRMRPWPEPSVLERGRMQPRRPPSPPKGRRIRPDFAQKRAPARQQRADDFHHHFTQRPKSPVARR